MQPTVELVFPIEILFSTRPDYTLSFGAHTILGVETMYTFINQIKKRSVNSDFGNLILLIFSN